jgi:hypothetical protein
MLFKESIFGSYKQYLIKISTEAEAEFGCLNSKHFEIELDMKRSFIK